MSKSPTILGKEVWKLDFGEGDVPVLLVNGSVPGITDIVARDAGFRALVMPDILRAILNRAIIIDRVDVEDSEAHVWTQWLNLAKRQTGSSTVPHVSDPSDSAQVEEAVIWVDRTVQAFAAQGGFTAATTYAELVASGA